MLKNSNQLKREIKLNCLGVIKMVLIPYWEKDNIQHIIESIIKR